MDFVNKIFTGDCLEGLKTLPAQCVNMCVTSPPYYGLRDYGTAVWEGGDPECDHKSAKLKSRYDYALQKGSRHEQIFENTFGTDAPRYLDICPDCGAVKIDKQIGLEKSPEEYVEKLINIFREVKRVLRNDGTLWLNLGDSYTNPSKPGGGDPTIKKRNIGNSEYRSNMPKGLKSKDLIGIPWTVAFALLNDGWYLRSDIIWYKKNPMPESVTDRPTKAHEYIFLLSKRQKYYYDAEAIKEKSTEVRDFSLTHKTGNKRNPDKKINGFRPRETPAIYEKRNKHSVWTVATQPFPDAHFAVFPERLIVSCIKAGCPEGGIILDPFMGSGTTAVVARKLDRNYIGFELKKEYVNMANKRLYEKIGMWL